LTVVPGRIALTATQVKNTKRNVLAKWRTGAEPGVLT